MIKISRKFSFLHVSEYWFSYSSGLGSIFGLNAFYHIKNDLKNPLLVKIPNYTVALDLTKSKEQILEGFSRTFNRLVRNAEKENVLCYFDEDIAKFLKFYNEFAALKGISLETTERMNAYGSSLKVGYAELNGEIMAAHAFIMDKEEKIVRLMLSSSMRFDGNFDSNLIGRGNKYLYYWEMLAFKELGIVSFDFGGYQETNSVKVIESLLKFKLDFGAEKVTTANYFSIPYFLLKKLYLVMGKAGKN